MRAHVSVEIESVDEGQREIDLRLGLGIFASAAQLDHLLSISRQVDVAAGEVLYKRGDPARQVFQVMSGDVELRSPTSPSWRIEDTGTAGLIDFMLGRAHARTAVATRDVRMLELEGADYREYLEDNFDVSHRLLARMSSELAAQSAASGEAQTVFALAPTGPAPRKFANVEIPVIERMMLLSHMDVFAHASMQSLATLGQTATEVRFAPGDVIATARERATTVSVLVEGTVELALPGGHRALRTGRSLLAHVEELSDAPRVATVTAMTSVISLQLEREELLDRIEEHFDLALSLFRFVAACQERMNDITVAAGLPLGLAWK